MGMSIQVNDFQWEPGKNDAEYIKLLESSRDEWQKIAQKAIAKLKALPKAQESKLVHVTADINRRKIGECPNCGKMINSGDYPNYCGRCGQAVKWDG